MSTPLLMPHKRHGRRCRIVATYDLPKAKICRIQFDNGAKMLVDATELTPVKPLTSAERSAKIRQSMTVRNETIHNTSREMLADRIAILRAKSGTRINISWAACEISRGREYARARLNELVLEGKLRLDGRFFRVI